MLPDDTVHFPLCIGSEPVKAESDQKGGVGVLGWKLFWRSGIRSYPDDLCGKRGIRSSRFMGAWVIRGLYRGEVQRGEAA